MGLSLGEVSGWIFYDLMAECILLDDKSREIQPKGVQKMSRGVIAHILVSSVNKEKKPPIKRGL